MAFRTGCETSETFNFCVIKQGRISWPASVANACGDPDVHDAGAFSDRKSKSNLPASLIDAARSAGTSLVPEAQTSKASRAG